MRQPKREISKRGSRKATPGKNRPKRAAGRPRRPELQEPQKIPIKASAVAAAAAGVVGAVEIAATKGKLPEPLPQ